MNSYEGVYDTNDTNSAEQATQPTSLTDKDLEEVPYDESTFGDTKSEGTNELFFNDYIDFKKTVFVDLCVMKEISETEQERLVKYKPHRQSH